MNSMEKKPYHHNSDGTFRNPEGSPAKTGSGKFSYKAEKSKKENEWDKIANYGNKINKKSRKKLH